jgi:hypothetical protein
MALRFKKEFENLTLALASGMLIDKNTIASDYAQEFLKSAPGFDIIFEEVGEPAEEPQPAAVATKKAKK